MDGSKFRALSNSITADDWNKNGGLLYQWGRKDLYSTFWFTEVMIFMRFLALLEECAIAGAKLYGRSQLRRFKKNFVSYSQCNC
ncbi:hypothetical protein [Chryseobacterium indoltheticum]|uniref:hypothetical protein n=1 Tax=Chryseobacterium indoltheticum TaxID=254 RepID=UPI003F496A2C